MVDRAKKEGSKRLSVMTANVRLRVADADKRQSLNIRGSGMWECGASRDLCPIRTTVSFVQLTGRMCLTFSVSMR